MKTIKTNGAPIAMTTMTPRTWTVCPSALFQSI